tara:strand:+ start:3219 stop:3728 length:510 start_codon:yes stop_codon:yes gene_type:complete
MEQNLENKVDLKLRMLNFYNSNKVKIFVLIIICFIAVITILLFEHKNQTNNILIAEKYVQAGLQLSANKKEKAKNLFEEIILSKNKFYSILSLNSIIENGLINDKNKILNYFEILQDINISDEKKDLIAFKKALYLIKLSERDKGEKLLKDLIKKNSQFKILAEEVIKN